MEKCQEPVGGLGATPECLHLGQDQGEPLVGPLRDSWSASLARSRLKSGQSDSRPPFLVIWG